MLTINNATKVVKLPYRPIGFKPQEGKEVTGADIIDWLKKESRGTIQCLPHFAVWTGIGTIASAILGFIGIKQDSKLCKWIGGILGLVGIAASGFGVYLARAISQIPEKEKKAKEEQEEKLKNVYQGLSGNVEISEENTKTRIQILNDESLKSGVREEALGYLLSSKHKDERPFNAVINFINDVKQNLSLRQAAMQSLSGSNELQREKKEEILLERLKDINEKQDTRRTALNLLRDIGDKDTITSLEKVKQSGAITDLDAEIETIIEYINDRISGKFEKQKSQLEKFESAKTDEEKLSQSINYIKDKTLLPECRKKVIIDIMFIISRQEQPDVIQCLIDSVIDKTDNYDVRAAAIIILKEASKGNQDEKLLQFLRTCVSDKSEHSYLRCKAIEALSKFEKQKATRFLLACLNDISDNEAILSTVVNELGKSGDESIIERLEAFKKSVFSQDKASLSHDTSKAIDKIKERVSKAGGDSKN